MNRYVCIHGHFYQPPRENPWLEEIEMQESAYPYHDWNERITAECYAPNSASRILSHDHRKIVNIVNNYSNISFNFGPTLLSWMEKHAKDFYSSILDADKEGFLRNETTLIQTMGRAARHQEGRAILYADKVTLSMKNAIAEVDRRRKIQEKYNKEHNIVPSPIIKEIIDLELVQKEKEIAQVL